ncbi:MAG: DNA-3-methyladenine glycosylase [Deltaproteobacteria bacterium]|nr:DNA-3-methyladenine glycosylase [Deltaproteobacteria bacterium]
MAAIVDPALLRNPALRLARELLGAMVVRRLTEGELLRARVVETEAYHQHDRACHAFGGRKTKRNAVMFEAGGVAYVYFVYGMHWAFNVVTGDAGTAEAVLIRAVVPCEGSATMARLRGFCDRRPAPRDMRLWCNGPGKVAQALGLTGRHSGMPLDGSAELWIEVGEPVADDHVRIAPRIGVDYAQADADLPWRFVVDGGAHRAIKAPPHPGLRRDGRAT